TTEIAGLPDLFEYAYRVDRGTELIDPCARLLSGGEVWADRSWHERGLPFRPYRSLWSALESRVAGRSRPERPRVAAAERVICELHVRGFTRHRSSLVSRPGTYLGLIEKLGYLRDLGVTTIELLPVFEFDETENGRRNPETGEQLLNFWGYSPVSFFAPKRSYAAGRAPGAELEELAELVDACHRSGLEVVLDVVYNHTAEGGGGAGDPLRSFRGLAEEVYYIRDPRTGRPFDCTGCGNTVNTNHPLVRKMILDSLHFWAEGVGVDGFRFDLASAFYRGLEGEKLRQSPIVDEITTDPVLQERLLIAEPWDVTGFSPPSGFPATWRVWNGPFRDDVRRYLRGDTIAPHRLALRLGGVPEPPEGDAAKAGAVVDFVTCHDGFTLADLFSYDEKHNAPNGEGGRDGSSFHLSWNHGAEGPSAEPEILELRARQARNALALLLLTRGTPMLLAGDERGRSQRGNNNAWCQDNEVSWIDWSPSEAAAELEELVRRLLALRREIGGTGRDRCAVLSPFASTAATEAGGAVPAALLFRDDEGEEANDGGSTILLALNPSALRARLPVPRAAAFRPWVLAVDTARPGSEAAPDPTSRPELAPDTAELELPPRTLRLFLAGERVRTNSGRGGL
ncbi:MAG: alpha-amylase family glycosyl hydrolase, partial [Thermoanaerobaculia bacterium]